jgi:hypothetical protein
MVALGVGLGTVIGFERHPVLERQAACKVETWRIVAMAKSPQLLTRN